MRDPNIGFERALTHTPTLLGGYLLAGRRKIGDTVAAVTPAW
jgi:hypothetical protein